MSAYAMHLGGGRYEPATGTYAAKHYASASALPRSGDPADIALWQQQQSDRHAAGSMYSRHHPLTHLGAPNQRYAFAQRMETQYRMEGAHMQHQQFPSSHYAGSLAPTPAVVYSVADQPTRFAKDKAANNVRVLDIDMAGYDSLAFAGQRVLVTGATRGLGLALCESLADGGATVVAVCRKGNDALRAALNSGDGWRGLKPGHQMIEGIDVSSDGAMATLVEEVGSPVDVVINNAGIPPVFPVYSSDSSAMS